MIGAVLCFTFGVCWNAVGQVMLDGKCYTGTLISKKDGKTYDEKIIFENGMIRSTACEAQGFKAGKYTATEKDGMTMVKGAVMNDKGDINEIGATIKGATLTGTLMSKMADGTMGETMPLTATLEKNEKKANIPSAKDQPAKMEHPSTEHPK